jgi:hypothetical protein
LFRGATLFNIKKQLTADERRNTQLEVGASREKSKAWNKSWFNQKVWSFLV